MNQKMLLPVLARSSPLAEDLDVSELAFKHLGIIINKNGVRNEKKY